MFEFEDPLGDAIVALLVLLICYGVFKQVTYYFKPYHKRKRKLAKLIAQTRNIFEIQQLHLEQNWLNLIANKYRANKQFGSKENDFTVFANIPDKLLLLPSVHDLIDEHSAHLFFYTIQDRTASAIANNAHYKAGCVYIPIDILPFPLDYTIFALDYLIANESFYDSDTAEAIARSKTQKRAIHRVLISHIVNVRSELLPIDINENERVGQRAIVKTT
ncbi:hypothetical protein E5K00_04145 [Hymenobacter aquaticus]|uniref:Uncharacterized protein n=1 Tax=Hymenobacter aquaticus TaxID=1867101 RepID=A0A4Z0Q4K0_9BACT|nr:hypothetical protein [Hymenobacter aquaticus]TGE24416.1 hypothetical protein E5K00_04145 [Hymenobacter aquaticus]